MENQTTPKRLTTRERDNYADTVILFLNRNENRNKKFKYHDLMNDLNIPKEYHLVVFNKLFQSYPRLIEKSTVTLNFSIWINQDGIDYATILKAKKDMAEKLQQIESYKLNALLAIKEHGIEKEIPWETIRKKANIPDEFSDDIKNILYHEGFMYRTIYTKGGDFIKGLPKISVYLLGIKSQSLIEVPPALNPAQKPATKKRSRISTIAQKIGLWIVSNIWKFIFYVAVAIAAAYILVRFKIPH